MGCKESNQTKQINKHQIDIESNFITTWKMSLFLCSRPYLNASKRELLADYALPVSVIFMSIIGALLFKDVQCKYTVKLDNSLELLIGRSTR